MEQDINQYEQLLTLVDEREISRLEYNRLIVDLITPTVLTSIIDMLELPSDRVECVDIDVIDDVLMVAVVVTYDPQKDTSPFLGIPPVPAEGAVMVQKKVRIGLPMELVFSSTDEIKQFLRQPSDYKAEAQPASVATQFDSSALSKEQVEQLLLFQHLNKGTQQ